MPPTITIADAYFLFFPTDTFSHNPQYRIQLHDVDEDDEEHKCTVIVAVMQKNRRAQRRLGLDCLTIGFSIYHVSKALNTHVTKCLVTRQVESV